MSVLTLNPWRSRRSIVREAQQASFDVLERLRLMVLETRDQRAPVASEQGPRFQRLAADATKSLERLVRATRRLERIAVTGLSDPEAAAVHAQFEQARRDKDVPNLARLVERFAR
jgi:hypothetical protein